LGELFSHSEYLTDLRRLLSILDSVAMLNVVLVESALEMVPRGLMRHPSVRRDAKRRGKRPGEILLNRSLHHRAMIGLPEDHKRGRPDIVHINLLQALGTPLNRDGRLKIWVHTFGERVIEVAQEVRLPRDCNRFNSLMEQLFSEGKVPPREEKVLLRIHKIGLDVLIEKIDPTITIALSSGGELTNVEALCKSLGDEERPLFLIGGFPHGPMRDSTLLLADEVYSINPEPLESWIVISRLIYEYERSAIA
jgi:rRNA small subunit pseudouridine methyltransferase Nep1